MRGGWRITEIWQSKGAANGFPNVGLVRSP